MRDLSDTTAVILAGGLGTRLRSVVSDRPKVLVEVNGRPFVTYLLDRLADQGVRRVVLCTGHLAERVAAVLGDGYRGMELLYSVETAPMGTGGALRLALPLLNSDPILVLNGDSFCDGNLALFEARHRRSGARGSLLLTTVAEVSRYGSVEIHPDGSVAAFEEKGARRGEGLINAGIYLLARSVIAAIPEAKAVSLEREVFPFLTGQMLFGFPQESRFIDIGIPSDYYAASAYLQAEPDAVTSKETT